nr:helix-turn-helix transcriptional regulator [Cellulomonas composti]
MDRRYADPLDVAALARIAYMSTSHFAREFHRVFGETPHRYLQRRRIERAMFLLRTTDAAVTEVCVLVGFTSLGTFSRRFTEVVGCSPTEFRSVTEGVPMPTSGSFAMRWGRPSSFGEARAGLEHLA